MGYDDHVKLRPPGSGEHHAVLGLLADSLSGADDIDEDAAEARVVQFDEEDALPGTERDATIHHGNGLAAAEEQVLDVGVAVGAFVGVHVDGAAAEVVVLIIGVGGGELAQGASKVAEQKGFVLVDLYGGGGVLGEDGDLAELDAGGLDNRDDVLGDIDELGGGGGLVLEGLAQHARGRGVRTGDSLATCFNDGCLHSTTLLQRILPKSGLILSDMGDNRNSRHA